MERPYKVQKSAIPDIPFDIVIIILLRLPGKSLLKFRCVSKSWRNLIDSSSFITYHLETGANQYIVSWHKRYNSISLLDIDFRKDAIDLFNPLAHRYLASCNGLLFLREKVPFLEKFALLNPVTRKYKILPPPPLRGLRFLGFGYDSVSDDYKVVFLEKDFSSWAFYDYPTAHVYSLRSNSWRRAHDLPYSHYYQNQDSVLACGALNIILSRDPDCHVDWMIVAFHLGTEEFRLVPPPEYSHDTYYATLANMGGCLSLSCNCDLSGPYLDIWVMKEYGVRESWIKILTVAKSTRFVRPIAYSRCCQEIILQRESDALHCYELEKGKVKSIQKLGLPRHCCPGVYVESLVRL